MRLPVVVTLVVTATLALPAVGAPGVGAADAGVPRAGVPGPGTLVADRIDLGSLAGRDSEAVAVSHGLVAGDSVGPEGRWHAVAFDLTRPRRGMQDLGRLGDVGDTWATDTDGRLVVGYSTSRQFGPRSWVVDTHADHPQMAAVGALGKGLRNHFYRGPAVADGVVVGMRRFGQERINHAFLYDATVAHPRPVDLGTLGGPGSTAVAIADGLVVGVSLLSAADQKTHVFAYDLDAASPQMVDLTPGPQSAHVVGTSHGLVLVERGNETFVVDARATPPAEVALGDGASWVPAAIDEGVAVGHGSGSEAPRIAFDLTRQPPAEVALGSLGIPGWDGSSGLSWASDVDGGLVVGSEQVLLESRAFASDVAAVLAGTAEVGDVADLGSGLERTDVWDVEGQTAVGVGWSFGHPDRGRAYAWTIHRTTGAVVSMDATPVDIEESDGHAEVTLVRTGDLTSPSTVELRPRWVGQSSAYGVVDFPRESQTVTFAAGQSSAVATVPVTDERVPEQLEQFGVEIVSATGADVGVPSATIVRIAPNDQVVDAKVRRIDQAEFTGGGIIGGDPADQTVQTSMRPGTRTTFYVRVLNDVLGAKRQVRLSSTVGAPLVARFLYAGTDVTDQVTSVDGWGIGLRPGQYVELTVRVSVPADTAAGTTAMVDVGGALTEDPTAADAVHLSIQVP